VKGNAVVRTFALLPTLMLALIPIDSAAPARTAPTAVASAGPVWMQTVGPGMAPAMPMTPAMIQQHLAQLQHFATEQQAFRSQMLGALTPAHRALLAQIVGGLAIAPAPDLAGAARQLNAALSSAEAQNVLRLEQARESAALQEMQQLAAQSGAPQTSLGTARSPTGANRVYSTATATATAPFGGDAGSILLRTAAMGLMQSHIQALPLRLPPLQPQVPAR